MSGGGTQKSLRKALGALKDTTTVSLAKVNSDYKELDVAIVKATNHVERPAKEKYIRAIFSAVSATRPRADVAYCIHALARRLSKTHNWAVWTFSHQTNIQDFIQSQEAFFWNNLHLDCHSWATIVTGRKLKKEEEEDTLETRLGVHGFLVCKGRTHVALKTLVVIHRALREVDPTFHEELMNYGRSRSHMLNLAHFKDDSSPNAWDYSTGFVLMPCSWRRDWNASRTKDLDTAELLEHLPALQQLLFRPQGAAVHNFVVQLALQMVASESIKIYQAISDGTVNLVDKFFEMQRHDAVKALDIYRRAGQQAERLSEFYEVCKSLDIGRGDKFIKIEQPPASFLQAMEEYVREAPRVSTVRKDQVVDNKINAPKEVLAIEYKNTQEAEARPPSPPPPEPVKVEAPIAEPPDLLGLNDPVPDTKDLDEKNAMALAIVPVSDQPPSTAPIHANGTTGWELALVTAPSSNESATAASKLAGGLDLLTLDSLYNDAIRRNHQNVSYNPWEPVPVAGAMMQQPVHDPFYASNTMAAPPSVQMAAMANHQQAFMLQQQQQMMMMGPQQQQSLNPFGNPHAATTHPYGPGVPVQAYNPYTGLL
ncbi:ENTH/ANTH/VHS superfamily protein [Prunus dulcis]|uniref:ENTH/ANTH/VHS superfamily protein n=1 Tax=Prunus dulcis TaxID=3755 RepID=A0A4Y1RXR8_PRUDU|nr:ENTH/ANTH/VHS superfamily protein [Prunus dulcis]